MSRWTSRRARDDEGFSLVEVLVAITLFGLFSTAIVPLLITAARASSITKYDTGARNLGQERLERMRTAPFHTPQAALAGPDLLDTYFPGVGTLATSVDAPGLVSATAARKEGEPAGAFYRYLVPATELAPDTTTAETFSRFTQRVATQFLNAAGEPFQPTEWNALVSPGDEGVPSFIVRATITTTWRVGALSKSYTVSSNLTQGRADAPLAQAELRATAVRISSSVPDSAGAAADLLFEGGLVTVDGQITRGAKVSSSSRGAFASLVPGSRVDGASGGASSPANATSAADSDGPMALSGILGELVRFGSTATLASATSADNGQLKAGSATSPVGASVTTNSDIRFTNDPADATGRLQLLTSSPVVRNVPGATVGARARAHLLSTGGSSHTVTGTAMAVTPVLAVLPTTYAPDGLVQVQLEQSELACSAGVGVTPTSLTYRATVRYWTYDPMAGTEGYVSTPLVLTGTSTSDALAALLGTPGDPATAVAAHLNPDGSVLTYADYFTAMSSATSASLAAERTPGAGSIESRHANLVALSTVSLREDIESPVILQLGVISCFAKDIR